jgi:protein CpxP
MKSGIPSLILTGLLASAGFATFAQTTTPEAARSPAMAASGAKQHHGAMGSGMHGKMDPAKREADAAKRMAELKAKLQIAADQEGAWTTFTTAMKPPTHMDHQRPDRAELAKLTTPERIDKMRAMRTQHMAERTAGMEKREEATKALYAALNADQKKVFDAEHARMERHHGGHHGGGK